jgi:hypothetical protein
MHTKRDCQKSSQLVYYFSFQKTRHKTAVPLPLYSNNRSSKRRNPPHPPTVIPAANRQQRQIRHKRRRAGPKKKRKKKKRKHPANRTAPLLSIFVGTLNQSKNLEETKLKQKQKDDKNKAKMDTEIAETYEIR